MSFTMISEVPPYISTKNSHDDAKDTISQSEDRIPNKQSQAPCSKPNDQFKMDLNENDKYCNKLDLNDLNNDKKEKRKKTRRAKKRKGNWERKGYSEPKRVKKPIQKAPDNTTQFIMNDHEKDNRIDIEEIRKNIEKRGGRIRRNTEQTVDENTVEDEDEFYSSPEDESDYLQQQFTEHYDDIHAERLNSMSRNELVQEYLQLEKRVENLEKRLKKKKSEQNDSQSSTENKSDSEKNDHLNIDEENRKLREENQRLRSENEKLNERLNKITVCEHPSSAS